MGETGAPARTGWHGQLVSARAALLRSARAQARNEDWAADAVSAVLLAALERPPPFDEADRVRAWLFGMLRHKLVDVLREQAPQRFEFYGLDPESVVADGVAPADAVPSPEAQVAGRRFIADLAVALDDLPALHRRAFVLREVAGDETGRVCEALGVTPSHLAVCLHRARARLRLLLAVYAD